MRIIEELDSSLSLDEIFRIFKSRKNAVFLDSSLKNNLGQFSIVGLEPYLELVKGKEFLINGKKTTKNFDEYLEEYLCENYEENNTELPIISGCIGYFSYEYGLVQEKVETRHAKKLEIPDCIFCFYDVFIIEDHMKNKIFLIANGKTKDSSCTINYFKNEIEKAFLNKINDSDINKVNDKINNTNSNIKNELEIVNSNINNESEISNSNTKNELEIVNSNINSEFNITNNKIDNKTDIKNFIMPNENDKQIQILYDYNKSDYMKSVSKMIEYIISGDIYIVNMTQQLTIICNKKPFEFFRKLREINPSPFGGFFNYDDFQIICSSPERFLKVNDRIVMTRPIKGTRPRGNNIQSDISNKIELSNSDKDKSELIMIVDLERNDLNKICNPGTVKVTDLFYVEEYATVFHLIANIEGELKDKATIIDLIKATFPGGSVTGAPKHSAMQLIDKVERSSRNLYTGSMGYISLDGNCDLNIIIRTAIYKDGNYYLGVGGGITCESDLEFEYEEILQKAKSIIEALDKE